MTPEEQLKVMADMEGITVEELKAKYNMGSDATPQPNQKTAEKAYISHSLKRLPLAAIDYLAGLARVGAEEVLPLTGEPLPKSVQKENWSRALEGKAPTTEEQYEQRGLTAGPWFGERGPKEYSPSFAMARNMVLDPLLWGNSVKLAGAKALQKAETPIQYETWRPKVFDQNRLEPALKETIIDLAPLSKIPGAMNQRSLPLRGAEKLGMVKEPQSNTLLGHVAETSPSTIVGGVSRVLDKTLKTIGVSPENTLANTTKGLYKRTMSDVIKEAQYRGADNTAETLYRMRMFGNDASNAQRAEKLLPQINERLDNYYNTYGKKASFDLNEYRERVSNRIETDTNLTRDQQDVLMDQIDQIARKATTKVDDMKSDLDYTINQLRAKESEILGSASGKDASLIDNAGIPISKSEALNSIRKAIEVGPISTTTETWADTAVASIEAAKKVLKPEDLPAFLNQSPEAIKKFLMRATTPDTMDLTHARKIQQTLGDEFGKIFQKHEAEFGEGEKVAIAKIFYSELKDMMEQGFRKAMAGTPNVENEIAKIKNLNNDASVLLSLRKRMREGAAKEAGLSESAAKKDVGKVAVAVGRGTGELQTPASQAMRQGPMGSDPVSLVRYVGESTPIRSGLGMITSGLENPILGTVPGAVKREAIRKFYSPWTGEEVQQ